MKKILKSLILGLLISSFMFSNSLAIQVNIDKEPLNMSCPPIAENGIRYISLRSLADYFDFNLEWQQESNTVVLKDEYGNAAQLKIGSKTGYFNGAFTELETAPKIVNGNIMIDIYDACEIFNFSYVCFNGRIEIFTSPLIEHINYNALGLSPEETSFLQKAATIDLYYDELVDDYPTTYKELQSCCKTQISKLNQLEAELKAIQLPKDSKLNGISKTALNYLSTVRECIKMHGSQNFTGYDINNKHMSAYYNFLQEMYTLIENL